MLRLPLKHSSWWGFTFEKYKELLKKQINDEDQLCCVMCREPFTLDPGEQSAFSISNSHVHHDHRVEPDTPDNRRRYGKTKHERIKKGIIGVSHKCCNESVGRLENLFNGDMKIVAKHLRKMADCVERYEKP